MSDIPVVLVFAGLDPTGGAGLQADIEALASMGCHAAPVATALTVQDTRNVIRFQPVAAPLVIEQARAVLEDMPVAAIKVGMLGSIANVEALHSLLADYPGLPLVLDPVLRAGGGTDLAGEELVEALRSLLLPRTTVLTPNGPEACRLAVGADTLAACAVSLQDAGCDYVLVTGGHEPGAEVVNTLHGDRKVLQTLSWPRLAGEFHGSGCTLSSALAGLLAQGMDMLQASRHAQEYTYATLESAYRIGRGQAIPDRFAWTDRDLHE